MIRLPVVSLAAALVLFGACAAHAAGVQCQGVISVESPVEHALTPAYDNVTPAQIKASYARAFAEGRRRAIEKWENTVASHCPGMSSHWFRAKSRSVTECDRAMGGRFTVCAAARPARKLF